MRLLVQSLNQICNKLKYIHNYRQNKIGITVAIYPMQKEKHMELSSISGFAAEPETNIGDSINADAGKGAEADFLAVLVGISNAQQISSVKSADGDAAETAPDAAADSSMSLAIPSEMAAMSGIENDTDAHSSGNTVANIKGYQSKAVAAGADTNTSSSETKNADKFSQVKGGEFLLVANADVPAVSDTNDQGDIIQDSKPITSALLSDVQKQTKNIASASIDGFDAKDLDAGDADLLLPNGILINAVSRTDSFTQLNAAAEAAVDDRKDKQVIGLSAGLTAAKGEGLAGIKREAVNINEPETANADRLPDTKANEFKIADTDGFAAANTNELTEKGAKDIQKGISQRIPNLNVKGYNLEGSQTAVHNALSGISKQSPKSTDAAGDIAGAAKNSAEFKDSGAGDDVKSLPQPDSASKSMFNVKLEKELPIPDKNIQGQAFAENKGAGDGFIESSANGASAVVNAGGMGNAKDILTAGKGEAHGQIDNKAVETQVVEKTLHGIRIITTDGGGRMKISLYPESLGHIRLDVSVNNDGIVNARMVTENPQVKEVIDNNLARLRDSLLQQGLKIDQFSVSVDQHKGQNNLSAHEQRMFWHKNPEQEQLADYNMMTLDARLTTYDSRIANGNVDIFV